VARKIVIREGEESITMPVWFKDLVTLGTILGNWDSSRGRLVLALACPTSRFAASAISLGILWAETKKMRIVDREAMLQRLKGVEKGNYISIRANSKQVIGRYLGLEHLEHDDKLHIGGSKYWISKIEELHEVKSLESPKDSMNELQESNNGSLNGFIDPNKTLSTLAQTIITLIGDKEKIKDDLNLDIGVTNAESYPTNFQKLSSVVKVKNDPNNFGWCAELLSVDEMLLHNNLNLQTHMILANNRSCVELSEHQLFKTKLFLLDSRDSLSMAHQSIQRYSRYCERLDSTLIGWTPNRAFRGLVMVDKNG
jgi:hypothetical protein